MSNRRQIFISNLFFTKFIFPPLQNSAQKASLDITSKQLSRSVPVPHTALHQLRTHRLLVQKHIHKRPAHLLAHDLPLQLPIHTQAHPKLGTIEPKRRTLRRLSALGLDTVKDERRKGRDVFRCHAGGSVTGLDSLGYCGGNGLGIGREDHFEYECRGRWSTLPRNVPKCRTGTLDLVGLERNRRRGLLLDYGGGYTAAELPLQPLAFRLLHLSPYRLDSRN